MTLVKVQETFNAPYAAKVYESILKMDDDEAQEFAHHVLSNYVEETIEKNLTVFQEALDRVIEKRLIAAKRAVAKRALNGDESAMEYARVLSEVSKADWDESLYRRDKGGRFATKVKPLPSGRVKPLGDRQEKTLGIVRPGDKAWNGMTPRQKAQYQNEYAQLATFLRTVSASGQPGDQKVILHLQDTDARGNARGDTYHVETNGTKIPKGLLAEKGTRLVGAEVRPTTLTAGGAAYSLSNALGRPMSEQGVGNVEGIAQGSGRFVNDWNKEGSKYNDNEQKFARVSAASELLGTNARPGSKRQMAAGIGQLVGSHGPEAEAVFGPHIRRTAYRYRGTEKTPDKHLVTLYNRQLHSSKMGSLEARPDDPNRPSKYNLGASKQVNLKGPAASQMAARRIMTERRDPTWAERRAARDVLTTQLAYNLPSKQLYELQLQSGNTPPSEGVLIDKHGKIVTQAVGYGDDHYLPFNLKNMKALRGGEYVRTRSVGGLTAEDVYTGLMSGARQVTVVSRSGTFTMQFEEDFTGTRRYNDKALRMTKRYQQILDAVQSEQVQRRDVPAGIRHKITQKVKEDFPGESPAEIRSMVNERVKEYKETPDLTDEDQELINELWVRGMSQDTSRDADEYRREVTNMISRSKGYNFRLDGRGYEDAAEALAEQFPYYIKTSSKLTADDSDFVNLERDRGYVEPGRNRPTAARAGLYGTDGGDAGKFSAADANYGSPRSRGKAVASDTPPAELKEGGEKSAAKKQTTAEKIKSAREKSDAGVMLVTRMKSALPDDSSLKRMDREELKAHLATPEGQQALSDAVDQVEAANPGNSSLKLDIDRWRKAGQGKAEFDAKDAHVWTAKPHTFKEAAYQPGASLGLRESVMESLSKRTPSLYDAGDLSQMDDAGLQKELQLRKDIRDIVEANPQGMTAEARRDESRELLKDERGNPGKRDFHVIHLLNESPEKITKQMENIQRIRTLKSMSSGTATVTPGAAAPAARQGGAASVSMARKRLTEYAAPLMQELNDAADQATNGNPGAWTNRHADLHSALHGALTDLNSMTDAEIDAVYDLIKGINEP